MRRTLHLALAVLSTLSAACGDDDPGASATAAGSGGDAAGGGSPTGSGSGGSGGAGGDTGGSGGGQAACTEPTTVPCSDEVFLNMNLQDDISPGEVTSVADGAGWRSNVDATAGGAFASDPDSYTYARFADAGLEKVAITDEESLESMEWDIAFRRYVVRINSGHSGPSCVRAARLPGTPVYEDVATTPPALTYRADEYFTESCEIIPDGSGLPNSPATALSGYWTYPGCVSMSGNVYVLELASGERVKLQVERYYDEAAQLSCHESGTVPVDGSGAANIVVRWASLP